MKEVREYSGFGEILGVDPVTNYLDAFPQAYTGRPWDADVEAYDNRARWYDPSAGRFLSEDPSGFSGGDANLYRYCGNNTPNYNDPSGLCWKGVGAGLSEKDLWFNNSIPSSNYITPSSSAGLPSWVYDYDFSSHSTPSYSTGSSSSTSLPSWTDSVDMSDPDPFATVSVLSDIADYYPTQAIPERTITKIESTGPGMWETYDQEIKQTGRDVGWFEWAGANVGKALLPDSEPSTIIHYSDGSRTIELGGGPSQAAMITQAGLLTGTSSALTNPGVVSKLTGVGKELIDEFVGPVTDVGRLVKRGVAGRVNLTPVGNSFGINAQNMDALDGYYDVIAHGSENLIQVAGATGKVHDSVNAQVLARYLQRYTHYDGQPIRLVSCNTGKSSTGFASQLSESLGGVEVMAPNNYIWNWDDGMTVISSRGPTLFGKEWPELPPTGDFVKFPKK